MLTTAAGGPAQALPNSSLGGEVGGALNARDGALKQAADNLDQLAFDLGGSLNAARDQMREAGVRLVDVTARRL